MSAIDDIEALALNAAKEALTKATKLRDKIDALKALAPYYLALAKARANEQPNDEGSMEHLTERIRNAEHEYDSRNVQDRASRGNN